MQELLKRYPRLALCSKDIENGLNLMIDTYKKGGKILLCGNGGSAADCEHIVGELMKGFMKPRVVRDEKLPEHIRRRLQGALPAISLPGQTAFVSAFNNDVDPETVYAQMVYGYAKENDLFIGISTSGNSKNVVLASETAKSIGIKTMALTGEKESRLSEISDVCIKVPETETYKVQEYHLPVYHYLCEKTEAFFF